MPVIDNGSVVIALLPGWLFLQEAPAAKLTGSALITVGLPVIAHG